MYCVDFKLLYSDPNFEDSHEHALGTSHLKNHLLHGDRKSDS